MQAQPAEATAATPAKARWSTSVQKTLKRASTSPKVASFLDQAQTKAQNLIKEGKLDQAQEMLKSYVKALPRDPAIKSEFAKVTVQRAQQLLSDQNIDGAAKMAREALSVQPQNQAAHTVLAQVLKKQGLSSESAPDRIKAANGLLAKGKVSEAEMEYQSANRIKPAADAYVGLGDIALKGGDKQKAKIEYQKALELEPHSGAALRQMGIIRLEQSDVVGANSDLSRALVVNPHDKMASKHLIDLWQKQVTHSPDSANSHLGLARAHQLSGDLQSAQSEYRKVVEIDPNNANLPAARQSFKLALARQEAQRSVEAARGLESAGAIQEAHARVSEAVKLCPGDSSFKLYQAQLSEKLGLNNEAHAASMGVLKDDPSNAEATQRLNGLSVAAPGLLLPGLAPPIAPSFRNSLSTTQAGQAFSGGAQEAPPAMAINGIPRITPISSTSQVSSMSGFLTSLRNYSVQQKYQSQQAEDAAHLALKGLTGAPVAASAATGLDGAVTQSPVLASASSNLANVSSLLASIGVASTGAASAGASAATARTAAPPALPVAAATAGASPDSVAALLDQAANSGNLSSLLAQVAPAFKTKKVLTEKDMSQIYQQLQKKYQPKAATSAAKTGTNAAAAPAAASPAQQNLEEQNKQLQSQLQEAQQQLSVMKGQPTLTAETPTASPYQSSTPEIATYTTIPSATSATAAAATMNAPLSIQSVLQSLPPSVTSSQAFQSAMANLPSSAADLQTYAANLPPSTQTALQAMLKPPIATPHSASSGSVRLELEGVKPSPLDIKLKVVLRNDQKIALNVPSSTRAIIRMRGEPQRVVKITFPAKNVPPNGEMHGVIKVPGHNLSPAADLFIPNMLPGQGIDRDLHLTVPISLK